MLIFCFLLTICCNLFHVTKCDAANALAHIRISNQETFSKTTLKNIRENIQKYLKKVISATDDFIIVTHIEDDHLVFEIHKKITGQETKGYFSNIYNKMVITIGSLKNSIYNAITKTGKSIEKVYIQLTHPTEIK